MEQKAKEAASHAAIPVSISAMLVTLGVVYGDIGTSPMYVTKALVAGNGGIGSVTEEFVLGALSLVVWTVTLLTTIKYVLISLRADNHGEGGIFALYSLVKRCGKWLIIPAMLGGAALLADGILTPAVTVTTAIEGLRTIPAVHAVLGDDQGRVVAITLAIIIVLFLVQRIGTAKIGHAFGPIMTLWFLFLGGTGLFFVFQHPAVLLCLNPVRGIAFLLSPNNHAGIMILGSCFLATTGAEALYSDMGHVGRGNIYATWPFVKCCLLLSYMGQGAWLMNNAANPELMGIADLNPFYQMLAPGLRPFAVGLSTVAAIIACNAVGDVVDPQTGAILAGARTALDSLSRLNAVTAELDGLSASGLQAGSNTTIGVIITDATLSKAQAQRLAQVGHDGLARTIRPVHTAMDGDTMFTLATGKNPAPIDAMQLATAAAEVTAMAVINAVTHAQSLRLGSTWWPDAGEA